MTNSSKDHLFGYGAALWALIFAALHVAWALGWYVGLDKELARQAFQRRWFLVYDLVAACLCVVAFAVALSLARQQKQPKPNSLVRKLAWAGTALLALRGAAGVMQDVYLAASGANCAPRPCFGTCGSAWAQCCSASASANSRARRRSVVPRCAELSALHLNTRAATSNPQY